ncbi:hypothetical protein L1278_001419 [Pontibacter sp. HSC-36F09]|nr:hypothetical protein [Pontibacter sp. HSC-36F09]
MLEVCQIEDFQDLIFGIGNRDRNMQYVLCHAL